MKRDEILEAIRQLASQQGSYSRMYDNIMSAKKSDKDLFDTAMTSLEEMNFKDTVDLVMYLEGQV